MMCFLKRQPPFDPALIDTEVYEGQLLRSKVHGYTLMPPPPIPGNVDREWTLAEKQMMRQNRAEAQAIYDRVKASDVP